MTEPTPPLPLQPKPSSALNDFYKSNQTVLDRLLMLIVTAILAGVFHVKLSDIGQNVESAKDVVTKTADVQQKVVAVEVRGSPQDVEALKAATQPEKSP